MQNATKNTVSVWQEKGRQIVPPNFEAFTKLVATARDFVNKRNYDMAAVYCEMATTLASSKPCGLFVSLDLEQILLTIGQKAIVSRQRPDLARTAPKTPQKVLHVATTMGAIGGHSRLLWRWIQTDSTRSHSIVMTRQFPNPVPEKLLEAVENSQGQIYQLNQNPGNLIEWAKQLRKIAATADLVILHIHNYDVIPTIAFANQDLMPPICWLDHADHLFWPGALISDLVISLRESAMELAQSRRAIEARRNVLLPILLEPIHRNLDRDTAKQQLGIDPDRILLLSIARGVKYKTDDGISFADAHVSLLQKYQNAILIVVGPGDCPDWQEAIEKTNGRIKSYAETEHTAIFYQAADIYVDSFPFASNTSLLEAGSYELPLVSRYPYPSEASAVLASGAPGLTNNLIKVYDLEEYTASLSKLIEDSEFRQLLGAKTRCEITDIHWEDAWKNSLEHVYEAAMIIPKIDKPICVADRMNLGEPDCFLHRVHYLDFDNDRLMQWYLPLMPFLARLSNWMRLSKKLGRRNNPINLLFPQWLRLKYYASKS